MPYNLIIILPFYNHLERFQKIAKLLKDSKIPILIINDGSSLKNTEGVKKICNELGFYYIEHKKNRGKGEAVLSGLKFAKDNNYTHAFQIDSDGQHNINDIKKFVTLSKEYPHALIAGAPIYDKDAPKFRILGHNISKLLAWIETKGTKIDDTLCGFRIYPINEISKILPLIKSKRMAFDIEIIVKAAIHNIHIINMKTKVKYPKDGASHYLFLKDSVEIGYIHLKLCFYSTFNLYLH